MCNFPLETVFITLAMGRWFCNAMNNSFRTLKLALRLRHAANYTSRILNFVSRRFCKVLAACNNFLRDQFVAREIQLMEKLFFLNFSKALGGRESNFKERCPFENFQNMIFHFLIPFDIQK